MHWFCTFATVLSDDASHSLHVEEEPPKFNSKNPSNPTDTMYTKSLFTALLLTLTTTQIQAIHHLPQSLQHHGQQCCQQHYPTCVLSSIPSQYRVFYTNGIGAPPMIQSRMGITLLKGVRVGPIILGGSLTKLLRGG